MRSYRISTSLRVISFALDFLAPLQEQQHAVIGFRRAQAVDAADGGDDDAVAALEQRPGGGKTQLVELVIDGGFLLDVNVAGGYVGFRLVIVVIRYEVFDRVVGEEALELVVKLGGQSLVVGQDQRRAIEPLDDLGHGEGLARAGHPQQHLVLFTVRQAAAERLDGRALVALRLVIAVQFEIHILFWYPAVGPSPHRATFAG